MKTAFVVAAVLGAVSLVVACDEDKKPAEPAASAAAGPAASAASPPVEPKASPAELQAKTLKSVVAAWNAHDATKVAATYRPNGKLVIPGLPDFAGTAAIAQEAKDTFAAYSDFKLAVTRAYVHGSTVALEWVITGTNDGPNMGQKASGRSMGVQGGSVVTFDDQGLIVEDHRYVDLPTIMSQLDPKAKAGSFRPVATLPAGATETRESKGTPDEAKTLADGKAFYVALETKGGDLSPFLTDDSTLDDMTSPAQLKGPKALVAYVAAVWKAVPDFTQTKPVQFAAGDVMVTEGATAGTQKGAFGPLKASNKPVSTRYLDFQQMKDGKAGRDVTYGDSAEMLVEIGAMPPLGAPPAGSASAAPPATAAPAAKPK